MNRFLKYFSIILIVIVFSLSICYLMIISSHNYNSNCNFIYESNKIKNHCYIVGDSSFLTAYLLIDEFLNQKKNNTVFPYIPKNVLATQLRYRLSYPETLSQGKGARNLCGPAAVAWCYLKYDPVGYTKTIIDLYERGIAYCGDYEIHTNELSHFIQMKDNQYVKDDYKSRLLAIDYILYTALRLTENDGLTRLFSFQVLTNSPFVNGTWPHEIVDLLALVNLKAICGSFYKHDGLTPRKSTFTIDDLQYIKNALQQKFLVILFIDFHHFNKISPSWFGSNFGNHFIVAYDLINYNDKQFSIKYWEFAKANKYTPKYTLDDFNLNIKGYWIVVR